MKKVASKSKYVTEKHLDKRLSEQTQAIIGAVDAMLSKQSAETNKKFALVDDRLGTIELKFDELRDDLRKYINNVQTLIDGYVKSQEAFWEEFLIMKEELKQIKAVLKKKLGLEIKAV